MINAMSNWFLRSLSGVLALAIVAQAPLAAAQDDEPNTWTDEPATPAPQAAPAPSTSATEGEFTDTDPRAISDFQSELEPYGQWVDDPTYGTVWVPSPESVGPNFAPYVTSGRWALTSGGDWIWQSDYPFGWVTFHYGRWVWISGSGWAWIPGRKYAHAWVVWRVPSDNYAYVGWAPAPPSYVWFNGVAVGVGFGVYTPWVFCPSYYAFYPGVHHYIVRDPYYVHRIAGHTHRYVPPAGRAWGPPPARARIPASAIPAQRVAANPRAVAAARRETALRAFGPSSRGYSRASFASPSRAGPSRLSGPRTLGTAGPSGVSSFRSRPLGQPGTRSLGSAPGGSYSGPARLSPGPSRGYSSAPRSTFSAPSRGYSPAPRSTFSAPSRSYYGPARSSSGPSTFSAPSRSYSPPMRSAPMRSAPSFSGGSRSVGGGSFGGGSRSVGGGRSFGGGGHSFGGGRGGGRR